MDRVGTAEGAPKRECKRAAIYGSVDTRVVHSSHFWAIFGSFSLFIFLSFFKNGVQNEMKMN